jgi:prolipoprotein diacylglyceryl transferase
VTYEIAKWSIPFGLFGARLYHLITDWEMYFGPNGKGTSESLKIWKGGLGIWGAIALGSVGTWVACQQKGIPFSNFADALAPGIILGQAIGRLGNYFNQELYGKETDFWFGMKVFLRKNSSGAISPHSLYGISTGKLLKIVHPTFLYEMIWNIFTFFLLNYLDQKFVFENSQLFSLYVSFYCMGRFWIELLRSDKTILFKGIRINVFTSLALFIAATVYFIIIGKNKKKYKNGICASFNPFKYLLDKCKDCQG